jgi:predicted RNA-binding Zn-ribbon protein involved in translation (DUF1610 family)
MMWEARAKEVEEVYGGFVDWHEAFYICPECGEPVYKCDWDEDELTKFLCPICEDGCFNEDEDDWDDDEEEDEFY